MKHSSFKRLAVCMAIAAAPAIALCQTTTTPSNQTGNNTPGQVLNNDTAPNGGTTGTYNGISPTRNNGDSNGTTYNGPDRSGYEKALRACNDMNTDRQSACRDLVANKYGQSEKSHQTSTAMEKRPRLSERCDQLYGTERTACMDSLNGGGK